MAKRSLPEGLDARDWQVSATIRDLGKLDSVLERLEAEAKVSPIENILDLGCGIGGLTTYVRGRVGASRAVGIDLDDERLARAAERDVETIKADLGSERLDLEDATFDLAMSFGALEHIVWYDTMFSEAARLIRPGGWFLLSAPNLGSYVNRAALLMGYQPRDIEVSWEVATGMLPAYRRADSQGKPLGHVHSTTLRSMTELLEHFGFEIVVKSGFSPDFGSRLLKVFDRTVGLVPSLSRRFIVLARRTPSG